MFRYIDRVEKMLYLFLWKCPPFLIYLFLYSSVKNTNGKIEGDYFTTMLYTNIVGDNLLVGAKNILYKLNAQELRLTQTLRWSSLEPEIDNCLVKGKTVSECQNYIKVLEQYKVSRFKLY